MAQENGPFRHPWTIGCIDAHTCILLTTRNTGTTGETSPKPLITEPDSHKCRYQGIRVGHTFSIYHFRKTELLFTPKTFPTLIRALSYILENHIYLLITPGILLIKKIPWQKCNSTVRSGRLAAGLAG